MGGSILDFIGDYVAPVALAFVPGIGPELSAIYTGVRSGVESGSPVGGLLSAVGNYAGNSYGSSIGGELFGNSVAGNLLSPVLEGASSILGSSAENAIGSGIGSMIGSSLGSSVGEAIDPGPSPFSYPSYAQPGFTPGRKANAPPSSVSNMYGNLSPEQQSSNIATQGVYGGGVGQQESQYFQNLINNRLVDDQGNVGDLGQVNPIEKTFLGQLGYGGYGNSMDLLKALGGGFATA